MTTLLKKLLKFGVVLLFIRNILVSFFSLLKKAAGLFRHLSAEQQGVKKFAIMFGQYIQTIKRHYIKLTRFQQKFFSSFLIGVLCYALFSFFQNTVLIKELTDKAFDNTLVFYTDYAKKHQGPSAPIYIGIDEESFQDVSWSQGSSKQLDLENVLELVDTAFTKGSRHVFVDMQNYSDSQMPRLQAFVEKYQQSDETKHLYMVVPFKPDPCLPTVPLKRQVPPNILSKLADNKSLVFGSLYIHAVTPSYYESADKVIRFWQLFGVYQTNTLRGKSWAFLPSPQMAFHTVNQIEARSGNNQKAARKQLNQLPWLHTFEYNAHKALSAINHAEYTDTVFKQLIGLSQSELLARYCKNDTQCLQHPFIPATQGSAEKAFAFSHELSSKIAHKGSESCIQQIDDFSQHYEANSVRSDMMQNRIVYSMRSWREDSNDNNQNYQMFTPLQLVDSNQKVRLEPSWQDKFVVVGAEFLRSGDANYLTPIGNMSGAMINLNAMVSFNNFGAIGLIGTWKKHLINLLLILLVSLLIARFNAKVAVLIFTITLVVVILFLYKWMFHNGVWIEFGLPIFVINIMQLIIEFLEKKKLKEDAEH